MGVILVYISKNKSHGINGFLAGLQSECNTQLSQFPKITELFTRKECII